MQDVHRLWAPSHHTALLQAAEHLAEIPGALGMVEQRSAPDTGQEQHHVELAIGKGGEPASNIAIVFNRHLPQGGSDVGRSTLALDQPLELIGAASFEKRDRPPG